MANTIAHTTPSSTPKGAIGRRQFMAYGTGVIGAVIASIVGIPIINYFISPALGHSQATAKSEWKEMGVISQFPVGVPTKVEYSEIQKTGWEVAEARKTVWVVNQGNGQVTAYNPRCTHLGCAVYHDEKANTLNSPCHGGVFRVSDGKVLAGPPPRALDTLPVKVENGHISVIYKDFRVGTTEKIEL
ncbi:MAG: Rieske 2Fe-2S domain-containing protein [Chloroflexi bacterium]|nr:Rieske 2Fe-2S domain-containing protein [Chloroflexota bacterium]